MYKIRAPGNYRIRLDFVTFNIEAGAQCENDALEIYEVQANGRRVFEKQICGPLRPNDYVSKSNNIDLYFKSDSKNQFSGFYIDYTTEKVAITTTNPTTTTTTPTPSTQGRREFCFFFMFHIKLFNACHTTGLFLHPAEISGFLMFLGGIVRDR